MKHVKTLSIKHHQLIISDDYGIEDHNMWEAEKAYFIEKLLMPLHGIESFDYTKSDLDNMIEIAVKNYKKTYGEVTLHYSESMSPIEYEKYCMEVLRKNEWSANTTEITGDQGVDIIARKGDISVAIQCKLYSQPVGNKAVQEAHSGKGYYKADFAVVVSNALFTRSAKELANSLQVSLLHHSQLQEIEKFLKRNF